MSPDLDPERLLRVDLELTRLARGLGACAADADEARQDAWLAAVESGPDEAGALSGWLHRALRFRLWRRRRGEARRHRYEGNAAGPEVDELGPSDLLQRQELRQNLVEAVIALPVAYRRAVILRFFEGLPPRQVAKRMGIPVETIRTRLKRALELLRQELDQHYGARVIWLAPLMAIGNLGSVFGSAGAVGSLSRIMDGVLIVSGKTKIAAVVTVILSLGTAAWWFGQDRSGLEFQSSERIEESEDVASARRAATPDTEPLKGAPGVTSPLEDVQLEPPPEPADEVVPTDGRIELNFVHAVTGRPAGDMPVRLLPFGVTDPFFRDTSFRTSKGGELVIESWPVGTTLVLAALGGRKRLKLKPGETLRETIEIAAGTKITGIVLSQDEQPLAGAEIVVSDMVHAVRGGPVTTTGLDGRFLIENIAPEGMMLLGARAAGHQPTPMVLVFPAAGDERELKLVAGGPASRLLMTIVNPEGDPVVGARCIVGPNDFDQFQLEDGSTAMTAGRIESVSDANGQLVFESLVPGDCPFELRGAGHAPRSGTVKLEAGQTTRERVVLGAGGLVTGVVLGPDGQGLERAAVTLGRYGRLSGHYDRTDSEGRFNFSDVAAGRHKIHVENKGLLDLRDEVLVVVGETTTWSGEMRGGPAITGLVVDDGGNPLKGFSVAAEWMKVGEGWSGGFAKSDEKGEFKLENLVPDRPYSVSVRGADGVTQLAREQAVTPGGQPLRLVIARDMLGLASAHGVLVDPEGRPVGAGNISAIRRRRSSGGSTGIETADGEGRFVFEKLTPGTYYFSISSPAFGHQRSKEFAIADGVNLDLGEIRFEAAGRVRVLVDDPAGLLDDKSSIWSAHQAAGSTIVIDLTGSDTLSQPLARGPYEFRLRAEGVADRFVLAEVRPGETTEIEFEAEVGRRVTLEFTAAGEVLDEVTVTVRDGKGRIVHDRSRKRYRDRPLQVSVSLARRDHVVEAVDLLGRRARVTIGAQDDEAKKIELR